MSLEQRIKQKIQVFPIGSEERNTLRVILGELLAKKACQNDKVFIEQIIRQNEDMLRRRPHPKEEERIR